MALTALIAAYHESAEPGALRATLPLAGRTVIERQVRLAAAAGASRVILFVERIPADLNVAVERLRRDRLPVQLARSAEEAAEAVDPHDRLILIADGAVADPDLLSQLARGHGATVLTVPDGAFGEPYERIDAASRWAGLAAVDGAVLRDTAAMLQDWDLQSTLLRRTLQAGAGHRAADGPVAILDSRADLAALERQILASAGEAGGSWASRLLAPLERFATLFLLGSAVGARPIGTAAAALTGAGALAFAYGWLWTGLILMILATPLDGIADRLARLRMQDDIGRSWWSYLLPVLSAGALIALSYALLPDFGWGMVLLAFTTLAFLIALGIETEGRKLRGAPFLAERKALVWLMLPFALTGFWHAGLALLFAFAAGSFFWAQRESHHGEDDGRRKPSPPA
ncbi:hypothetical protein [Sphingosinicella terrae]|uniref:hypothetical protein n=1 Tax=Sphingosinicella terrae TaxID=2172047 RepID=UPI000E0D00D3|nr:hypothetical protein [Sphingosinicella terrae]